MSAKNNSQFIASVHSDYLPFIKLATDEELAQFIRAQICHSLGEDIPDLTDMAKALFDAHLALIERLEESSRKKSEAGEQGGAPRGNQNAKKQPKTTENNRKQAELENDEVCLNKNKPISFTNTITNTIKDKKQIICADSDEPALTDAPPDEPENPEETVNHTEEPPPKPSQNRFIKPTVDEVRAYCQTRQNRVDPEQFFDFYESKGWVVGKSPMRNWKSAVHTWERNSFSLSRANPSQGTQYKYIPPPGFDLEAYCTDADGVWDEQLEYKVGLALKGDKSYERYLPEGCRKVG